MNRRSIVIVSLFVVIGSTGCSRKLTVLPEDGPPGQPLYVRAASVKFTDVLQIEATIGRKRAGVVRIIDATTVEIVIPDLDPGIATVEVRNGGRIVGKGTVEVTESPMRRLFLVMQGDQVVLHRFLPYAGRRDPVAAAGQRISYDVFYEDSLVYSGAIPDPRIEGYEFYHHPDPNMITRVRDGTSGLFEVKIPNRPKLEATVRFYRAGGDVDLATAAGRQKRVFLNEIRVAP